MDLGLGTYAFTLFLQISAKYAVSLRVKSIVTVTLDLREMAATVWVNIYVLGFLQVSDYVNKVKGDTGDPVAFGHSVPHTKQLTFNFLSNHIPCTHTEPWITFSLIAHKTVPMSH